MQGSCMLQLLNKTHKFLTCYLIRQKKIASCKNFTDGKKRFFLICPAQCGEKLFEIVLNYDLLRGYSLSFHATLT